MPTDFETAVLAQSPIINVPGPPNGADNLESNGSDAVTTFNDVPPIGADGVGPTGAGDAAWNPNDAGFFRANFFPSSLDSVSEGVIIASIRVAVSTNTRPQYIFTTGRRINGAAQMELRLNSDGNLSFWVVPNGFGSNSLNAFPTSSIELDDDEWHFVAVRQKADGTGPELYVDGSWLATTVNTLGTATEDDFFSTFHTAIGGLIDSFALAAPSANSSLADDRWWNGLQSHFAIFGSALSDVVIADLYAEWLGGPEFDNKTIRRKGRKLFFDFSTL